MELRTLRIFQRGERSIPSEPNLNPSDSLSGVSLLHRGAHTSPRVSILVRTKNEMAAMPLFWERIRKQTIFKTTEILVLDSGSTDGTPEFLKSMPCNLYALQTAFNFGRSCNQLAELATSPILIFLSGHVLVEQMDALEQIALLLEQHKNGAAYLRQIPNPLLGFSLWEKSQLQHRFSPGSATVRQNQPAGFSNAASAITRSAWLRQPFDEVHGSEDFFWAGKHLASGGELFYMPQLQVLHSHNESAEQLYERIRINVEARSLGGSLMKGAYFLIGVYISMRKAGAPHGVAIRYASAHAKAYL